jgi:LuxR family maltose regulon positive regulatory protein
MRQPTLGLETGYKGAAAPEPPLHALDRPELLERLDGALHRPLTVVSAPGGFGKSVAVAQWCATRAGRPVEWCTAGDLEAVDHLVEQLVDADPVVVVLDDLELPDLGRWLQDVAARLSRRPDTHLIVLTRQDVAAELPAERLAGTLELVVERDLRFGATEMAELVRRVAGAAIRPDLAEALVEELEGWPAGAMLLALDWDPSCSLANHRTALAAGYRSCRSLLRSLVLDGLEPAIRRLVLDTAELPELSEDLCTLVFDPTVAAGTLEQLRRSGRFLAESGVEPVMYRFHRLARAALMGTADRPAEAQGAHDAMLGQGAAWYLDHGLLVLAASCYVELREWDALAELVFGNLFELLSREQLTDLVRVLSRIPAAVLRERWSWTYGVAYLLLALGELSSALSLLATVEPGATPAQLVVSEVLRACAAPFLEDPTPSLEAAEHALALCAELGDEATFPDPLAPSRTGHWRSQAQGAGLLAGAFVGSWERVARHAVHLDGARALELPPAVLARMRGQRAIYFALAGDLVAAEHEASAVLATSIDEQLRGEHYWASAHLALAMVLRARVRLEEALEHLDRGMEQATSTRRHNLVSLAVAEVALAHLDAGRPDTAARLLVDHRRAGVHRSPPVLLGRLDAAELLVAHRLGDRAHVTERLEGLGPISTSSLAAAASTVHLERGDVALAEAVLQRWPHEPTTISAVQEDLVRAALAEVRGRRPEAIEHLAASLVRAAPHGWLQPFARLGVFVLRPLRTLADTGPTLEVRDHARAAGALIDQGSTALGLLTPRERLVLHHLTSTASLPELAAQLMVSTNTIKTQVKAVYRKLGVASRSEAVAVWRAAGEPPPS